MYAKSHTSSRTVCVCVCLCKNTLAHITQCVIRTNAADDAGKQLFNRSAVLPLSDGGGWSISPPNKQKSERIYIHFKTFSRGTVPPKRPRTHTVCHTVKRKSFSIHTNSAGALFKNVSLSIDDEESSGSSAARAKQTSTSQIVRNIIFIYTLTVLNR